MADTDIDGTVLTTPPEVADALVVHVERGMMDARQTITVIWSGTAEALQITLAMGIHVNSAANTTPAWLTRALPCKVQISVIDALEAVVGMRATTLLTSVVTASGVEQLGFAVWSIIAWLTDTVPEHVLVRVLYTVDTVVAVRSCAASTAEWVAFAGVLSVLCTGWSAPARVTLTLTALLLIGIRNAVRAVVCVWSCTGLTLRVTRSDINLAASASPERLTRTEAKVPSGSVVYTVLAVVRGVARAA